jgi:hypothetical protein
MYYSCEFHEWGQRSSNKRSSNQKIYCNLTKIIRMKEKITKYAALFFSGVFHPLLIPTMGLLLIMGFIPGVEYFSFKLRFVILGVIFLSTCIIPLIFITLGNIHRGLNKVPENYFDRVMPYLFTAMCAFLGSQFFGKLPIPEIFRIFLLSICFIMIISTLITFKWKLSNHILSLGGFWGVLLALNFKFGMSLLWLIIWVIIISGIVGSTRIYLEKDSPHQVYISFLTGVVCMFLLIVFI